MKTTKSIQISLLFVFLALLLGTISCIDEMFLEGNGIAQTEYRSASGFRQIAVSGDFHVTVMPGNNYSIEVTAESNLLSYIETDLVGSTLKIRTRGLHSLRQNIPIEVYVTTPVLNGLTLSGSGLIETGDFISTDFDVSLSGSGNIETIISADHLKANVSGSGIVHLEGDAQQTNFVISGSGKIKSYKLEQQNCQAIISGSGDMFVNATQTLSAAISGSGRVYYINHPLIHTSISGSGTVVDKN